jgi:hypothetical protein
MSSDENEMTTSIAILTVGGGVAITLITLLCKYAYRLKCNEVSLCYGACVVKRDIPDELRSVENGGAQAEIPAAVGNDDNSSPSSRTQFQDVFKPKGACTGLNRHSI